MSDTPANSENPVATRRHWQGTAAIGITAAALVFWLVLPGFVAGIVSRAKGHAYLFYTDDSQNLAEKIFFAPANFLDERVPAISRFYWAQYRWAGGITPRS